MTAGREDRPQRRPRDCRGGDLFVHFQDLRMTSKTSSPPRPLALSRRHWMLALGSLGITPLLGACGSGEGNAKIRVVNATQGLSALDAYLDTQSIASSVASASCSSYSGVDADTYTLGLRSAGSAVNSVESSLTLSEDSSTTVVVTGTQSALSSIVYTENESSPSSGYAKLRLINGLQTGNGVDVYITATSATSLDNQAAAISNVAENSTSSFCKVSTGTYSLWITGNGDTTDLRFYVASITLSNQGIDTLVLVPTNSTTLASVLRLPQQGSGTSYPSTLTRIRFVNAASASTSAQASLDGTAVSTAAIGGYGVSSYSQVTAGSRLVGFSIGGATVSNTLSLGAGNDMTVALTLDSSGAYTVVGFVDNNFPSTSSSKSKIRLVNLAPGAGSAQLTYNGGSLLADYTAVNSASSYASFTAGEYDFVISASGGSAQTLSSYTSVAGAVYSAFAFGASTVSKFTLRQDG